jgi:hypothetical protein
MQHRFFYPPVEQAGQPVLGFVSRAPYLRFDYVLIFFLGGVSLRSKSGCNIAFLNSRHRCAPYESRSLSSGSTSGTLVKTR